MFTRIYRDIGGACITQIHPGIVLPSWFVILIVIYKKFTDLTIIYIQHFNA